MAHITDFNISFGHYPLPSLMPLLLIFTLLVIRVELYHNTYLEFCKIKIGPYQVDLERRHLRLFLPLKVVSRVIIGHLHNDVRLLVFAFFCKLGLLLFKHHWDDQI